jgi:hypothetical protein
MRVFNFLKAVWRISGALFHLYWLVPAIVIMFYPDSAWRMVAYIAGVLVGIRMTITGTKNLHQNTIKKVLRNSHFKYKSNYMIHSKNIFLIVIAD